MTSSLKITEEHLGKYLIAESYEENIEITIFEEKDLNPYFKNKFGLSSDEEYNDSLQKEHLEYIKEQFQWLLDYSKTSEEGKKALEDFKSMLSE